MIDQSHFTDETPLQVKCLVWGHTAGSGWSQTVNFGSLTRKGLRAYLLWCPSQMPRLSASSMGHRLSAF